MRNDMDSQEVGKIIEIKKEVAAHLGEDVDITDHYGRKRENRHKVTLTEVFDTHFVVEKILPRGQKIVESYMYADILTQSMLIHYKG
ncbi:Veg family protein [Lactococcus hodotermopsidis]|nr:Veg family protein [Lactococcus hodotermopsidis]